MNNSIQILWQDEHLIAVNKQAGMLSIPDRWNSAIPSLLSELRKTIKEVFIIHRLDRETSGVILFAKNAMAHKKVSVQFENKNARKVYDVLVQGHFMNKEGLIEGGIAEDKAVKGKMMAHPKGKASQTFYRVMETWGKIAYIQVQPLTGRTHQIRVHLQDIGHPLLVDPLYGGSNAFLLSSIKRKYKNADDEKPLLSRVSLHSRKLTFIHPQTNEKVSVETDMPKDMLAVIQQLRKLKI